MVAVLVLLLAGAVPGSPDPAAFDAVLAARAREGGFDYRGATGQDRKRLGAYIANLGDARTEAMRGDERKAFFINAYNALAIQTLLENPGKKILDVPGAFDGKTWRVAGRARTLDEIEKVDLKAFGDPRIHFAIVCASASCPPLAATAYRPEGLDAALDRQARAFVNDPRKNRLAEPVALSKIFEWNRAEFEAKGEGLARVVSRWVEDPAARARLASHTGPISFLEYDWSPNQP
ncbi:MAG TPA: DUF547 domain-containing protein [Thermoanaerobaculia bacterium]|jgi:hypothetical protein